MSNVDNEQEIKGGEVAAAAVFVGFIAAVVLGVAAFLAWGLPS